MAKLMDSGVVTEMEGFLGSIRDREVEPDEAVLIEMVKGWKARLEQDAAADAGLEPPAPESRLRAWNVQPGEPIFVLHGSDLLSPETLREWTRRAQGGGMVREKAAKLFGLADEMEAWAEKNGGSWPR